jgi:hypothetical protein
VLRALRPICAVLLIAAALPVAAAPKGQSAVAYVESIYADHESPGGAARYSPRLDGLWDECYALAKKNGDACMDFSMIVMGNDALLTDVKVQQKKGGPHSAAAPDGTNLANFMSSSWLACGPVGGYGDSYGGRRLRMQRHPHFLGDVFVIGFARG